MCGARRRQVLKGLHDDRGQGESNEISEYLELTRRSKALRPGTP
jgi:hypothetical protein